MIRRPSCCQSTLAICPLAGSRPQRRGQSSRRHRWAAALLFLLAGAVDGWAADTAPTDGAQVNATGRGALVTAVAGIVAYTRWPAESTSIRLCTMGQGRAVDDLLRSTELGSPQRSVSVRATSNAVEAAQDCDAVFVGHVGAGMSRELLQRSLGRPVLMLGEGAAFCADGGMFCLEPTAAAVRFQANLDAIARSGLRVNPLVLRIARQPVASGS